ncbi:MAG: hypothetical protein Kow0059_17630 [Candidatus Sumerlaeia bacterium]
MTPPDRQNTLNDRNRHPWHQNGRDDKMDRDDKDFVDTLLRRQFGEDVPPEVEARMRERLAAFRKRLASHGTEHSRPSPWARAAELLGGRRAAVALGMGLACMLVAALMVRQGLIPSPTGGLERRAIGSTDETAEPFHPDTRHLPAAPQSAQPPVQIVAGDRPVALAARAPAEGVSLSQVTEKKQLGVSSNISSPSGAQPITGMAESAPSTKEPSSASSPAYRSPALEAQAPHKSLASLTDEPPRTERQVTALRSGIAAAHQRFDMLSDAGRPAEGPAAGSPFIAAKPAPPAKVSSDAGTAGVERWLLSGALPPPDQVCIEELINSFTHDATHPPHNHTPITVHTEVGPCPWRPRHRLLWINIEGRGTQSASNWDAIASDTAVQTVQIEFEPARVLEYHRIGCRPQSKTGGDQSPRALSTTSITAGRSHAILYEIVPAAPAGAKAPGAETPQGQTSKPTMTTGDAFPIVLGVLIFNPTAHEDGKSSPVRVPVFDHGIADIDRASPDFRFAAAVAAFGMILRREAEIGDWTMKDVRALAEAAVREDRSGRRGEFLTLIDRAAALMPAK